MSIEQLNVVDFIGIDRETEKVVLTISDHLDWDSPDEHLLLLQEKIDGYIGFIESGELQKSYPDAEGRSPVIQIVARVPCPSAVVSLIDNARSTLGDAGIELQTRILQP